MLLSLAVVSVVLESNDRPTEIGKETPRLPKTMVSMVFTGKTGLFS